MTSRSHDTVPEAPGARDRSTAGAAGPAGPRGALHDEVVRRREIEQRLAASEARYRTVVENVNVGILVVQNLRLVFANQTLAAFFNRTTEEILALRNPYRLIHPADRKRVLERHANRLAMDSKAPETYRFRVIVDDSDISWVEVTSVRIEWQGEPAILDFFTDITERKLAVDRMEELNAIVNRSPVVVFVWEDSGDRLVTFVTENVTEVFGYTAEEFITGRVKYPDILHPEDRQRVLQEVSDGNHLNSRGELIHSPYRILTKNGRVRWIEDRTSLRKDERGRVTHHQGIVTDITERVQAETERINKEKLQGVIETAGAVCHELNQPLQSITGHVELLLEHVDDSNPVYEKIVRINRQVERMAGITGRLRRITSYETKPYLQGKIIDIDKSSVKKTT
jgi:PAS domain S-box-containing protein